MAEVIYQTERRLDINTAGKLSADLEDFAAKGVFDLVIDMGGTTYISSVALRALLSMQKKVNAHHGQMLIRNANETVREVFDVTGYSGFLTIEE